MTVGRLRSSAENLPGEQHPHNMTNGMREALTGDSLDKRTIFLALDPDFMIRSGSPGEMDILFQRESNLKKEKKNVKTRKILNEWTTFLTHAINFPNRVYSQKYEKFRLLQALSRKVTFSWDPTQVRFAGMTLVGFSQLSSPRNGALAFLRQVGAGRYDSENQVFNQA